MAAKPNISLLLADVDGTLVTRDKVLTPRARHDGILRVPVLDDGPRIVREHHREGQAREDEFGSQEAEDLHLTSPGGARRSRSSGRAATSG